MLQLLERSMRHVMRLICQCTQGCPLGRRNPRIASTASGGSADRSPRFGARLLSAELAICRRQDRRSEEARTSLVEVELGGVSGGQWSKLVASALWRGVGRSADPTVPNASALPVSVSKLNTLVHETVRVG